MNTEQSFMKAIVEAPEDDSLRLIFADWLEERGDPRGEFIRVQYALAETTTAAVPDPALLVREQELLALHGSAWTDGVSALSSGWEFRRGFIEQVSLEVDLFFKHGPSLFQTAPVQAVKLRAANGEFIPHLVDFPCLARVRGLDLGGANIGDLGAELLAASAHLGALETLKLDMNMLGPAGVRALASAAHLRRLKVLNLGHNPIDDLGLHALCGSPHLPALTELHLSDCGITSSGIRGLAQAPLLARLHVLDLSRNALGNFGLRTLAASPRLKHLRSLDLGSTSIGTLGVQTLAAAPALSQLRELNLSNNPISDGGAQALAQSPHLAALAQLNLSGGNIGAAGRQQLKERFGGRVFLGNDKVCPEGHA